MKTFVTRYKAGVELGPEPSSESRYILCDSAGVVCRDLNKSDVRTGEHHCSFTVDMLPQGDFGIICICHPHAHLRLVEDRRGNGPQDPFSE